MSFVNSASPPNGWRYRQLGWERGFAIETGKGRKPEKKPK